MNDTDTAIGVIATIKAKIAVAQVYAKFIVAAVGGALTIGTLIIPADWAGYVSTGLIVLTAFSVFKFTNGTKEVSPI